MCGIFGMVENGNVSLDGKLAKMATSISHRGPDDQNWVTRRSLGQTIGYGIDRLAIIDRSGGKQPISSEDGNVEVVFNGEIYNYGSLKVELESQGHVFKTNSDTEVLVHLYEQHGFGFLHRLRGMFAFSIFDKRAKLLFLARDHVGIKPLYYTLDGNRFAFGSEIKAITSAYPGFGINPNAIADYFTFRYIPGPDTIWRGIHALPPGHHMVYDLRTRELKIDRWWTMDQTVHPDTYENAVGRTRELLIQAVRRRLQSEVPLGAFLSGGVDSSVICAVAAKELGTDINVYNVGYPNANEYGYAGGVARELGLNYFQCGMTFDDMVNILPDVLNHMDQPLSDAACFPTLHLSRIAKRGCTVMLSGEGADEIFAGYWQYDSILKARDVNDVGMPAMLDHLERSNYFLDRKGIVTSDVTRHHNPLTRMPTIWNDYANTTLQSRITRMDTLTWLPDDLLMKVDKMTMGASVEARVPFLDRDLMEYVVRLPDEFKYNGTTKRILKDVAESFGVSSDITRRPKMGFTVPTDALLRGPFKEGFKRAIHSQRFRNLGAFLDMRRIDLIINQYYAGNKDLTLFCWTLFVFAAWLENQT